MNDEMRMFARMTLVLVVALVLQLGVVDSMSLLSVHPELLLAVGVGTAVAWGAERGAVVGFITGLLADLFLSGRFGATALAYGLAGYGVGMLADATARRSPLVDAALMALGSAAAVLLYAVIATLFGADALGDDHLGRIVAIVGASSAVLSPLVLPTCRWAGRTDDRLRPIR